MCVCFTLFQTHLCKSVTWVYINENHKHFIHTHTDCKLFSLNTLWIGFNLWVCVSVCVHCKLQKRTNCVNACSEFTIQWRAKRNYHCQAHLQHTSGRGAYQTMHTDNDSVSAQQRKNDFPFFYKKALLSVTLNTETSVEKKNNNCSWHEGKQHLCEEAQLKIWIVNAI